jgi:hypothetical protein
MFSEGAQYNAQLIMTHIVIGLPAGKVMIIKILRLVPD